MWIRYDDGLACDPDIGQLRRKKPKWVLWWLDLALLARDADADGELLYRGRPWTLEQLAYHLRTTTRAVKTFVDAMLEMELLELLTFEDGAEVLRLPNRFAHLWGSPLRVEDQRPMPVPGAVRSKNYRERQKAAPAAGAKQESPEADASAAGQPTRDEVRHEDASRSVTQNVTERDGNETKTGTVYVTRSQISGDLGSLDLDLQRDEMASRTVTTSVTKRDVTERDGRPSQRPPQPEAFEMAERAEGFGEVQFWRETERAFVHFVRKPWTEADREFCGRCLRQPWASTNPSWLVRFYAFLSGFYHMVRTKDVDNPLGYALSVVHKYADPADEFVAGNARRRAAGLPLFRWRFRPLDPVEDCIGPDYALRGEPETKAGVA